MKLHAKIPALVLPLVVAPLLVLGAFAYSKIHDNMRQRVEADAHRALRTASGQLSQEIAAARGNLQLFLSNIVVAKYATTSDENERYSLLQKPLLEVFKACQTAFPNYFEIRFLLPDGYEDARQSRAELGNTSDDESASVWFKRLTRSTEADYATVYLHPDTGLPALFVGTSVKLRDATVDAGEQLATLRGYLGISADLGDFSHAVSDARVGETGYMFATDNEGHVLFGNPKLQLPADFIKTAEHALKSQAEEFAIKVDGMPTGLHVRRLNDNLLLFAAHPDSEMQSLTMQSATVVLFGVLVVVLFTGGGLVAVLARHIVRPVERLGTVAAEIGTGNWDIKSGIASDDEIGDLARSVEDMASNLKEADDRVRFLAYHDNLTGLPNRVMFREYLTRALSQAERADQKLGILFLDIDGFKRINDTLGHQTGDLLLKEVARRLTSRLREEDVVAHGEEGAKPDGLLARLGGDEFIVLLTAVHDLHGPGTVARRFIKSLGETITLNGQDCHIGASIGIAIYPDDGSDAGELIKNADIAMYHAKSLGKNAYQYFQSSMNAAVLERAALEAKLRRAIGEDQLSLNYQPQINPRTTQVVGLEALLRWTDPESGPVSPGAFIPLAEETGLILPIGEWVIDEACRQARQWDARGLPSVPISVNVSGVQFERQDVAEIVRDAVTRHQLPPGRLEIEITESAIMRHPERAVAALKTMRESGVGIALDDFGTGYSSLSYLRRFPIDTLKIDRSFILEIDQNEEDAEIVAAIVAMAHTLGLRVIVEGVETESQLDVIIAKDCDVVQGFVFSRALPASDIPALLRGPLRRSA
ncbi:MAG: EAL domain-containing protein [Gammaproteobacteria bacterium]|nr:EAL domain-containing protein [Gammaproteobacteria bacterium]